MKKILALLTFLPIIVSAQSIQGTWNGALDINGTPLPLILNISGNDTLAATLQSPMQSDQKVPLNEVSFSKDNSLQFSQTQLGATFKGIYKQFKHAVDANTDMLDSELVVGTFAQNGMSLPLTFKKAPRTWGSENGNAKPLGYNQEEVTFKNETGGFSLAGTYTFPFGANAQNKVPAVILISGSGPQDRDETILGKKPFFDIANYLSSRGYAVLRYDDRGVGKSGGEFVGSTTYDFATDVAAAVKFLKARKEIGKIGLIGHSEGGLIAPLVASEMPNDIGFVVLLAGPGVSGAEIMLQQQKDIGLKSGATMEQIDENYAINKTVFDILSSSKDTSVTFSKVRQYLTQLSDSMPEIKDSSAAAKAEFIHQQEKATLTPWMVAFINFNPQTYLSKVKCPLLAINGSLDLQVNASQNLPAIKSAVLNGGNKQVTTILAPDLNHLFQRANTGLPNEYGTLGNFSDWALTQILDWLNKNAK